MNLLVCGLWGYFAVVTSTQSETLSLHRTLKMGGERFVRDVAFSPDAKLLAVSYGRENDPGRVALYSVPMGELVVTLKGDDAVLNHLAFTPNGQLIIAATMDNQCLIWETATYKRTAALTGHTDVIMDVSISPSGQQVATCGGDKTIIIWDLATTKTLAVLKGESAVIRLAHSPNGKLLASGAFDGRIRVFDTKTTVQIGEIRGAHNGRVTGVKFTPDGKFLASCGSDGLVHLWETKNWTRSRTWGFRAEEPGALAISPDGTTLALGMGAGEVIFINLKRQTGQKAKLPYSHISFEVHNLGVTTVTFRGDGKMFASGSLDTTVKLLVDFPGISKE